MVIHYSCCTYVNSQAKFASKLVLIWLSLVDMSVILKITFSVAYLCRPQILVLLIVFEVLLSPCKLDRILNSFCFVQYLATTL